LPAEDEPGIKPSRRRCGRLPAGEEPSHPTEKFWQSRRLSVETLLAV
jgi:hypothetical protein